MDSPEFWKQFRTPEEVLSDEQYERHQAGDCINFDTCKFCDEEDDDV